MDPSQADQIATLVKARTAALQRISSTLARRGLEELERLTIDPEVLRQVSIIQGATSWDEKSEAWQKLRKMGPEQPGWENALRDLIYAPNGWARIFAAEALSSHACLPEHAVPVLAATLEASLESGSHDWAIVASGAIWKYGKHGQSFDSDVLFTLTHALRSRETTVQAYSAATLGYCGSNAQSALVELARLHDSTRDHNLKETCLCAMQQISPAVRSSFDAYLAALHVSDPTVRGEAVCEIAKFGGKAAPALSHLLALARDQSADVRRFLGFALGKIGNTESKSRSVILALSQDEDTSVRLSAAYACLRLGFKQERSLAAISEALNCDEDFVRFLAAWALSEVGGYAPDRSHKLLSEALKKEGSDRIRETIKASLKQLGNPHI
jgi:HEAT repeat protein